MVDEGAKGPMIGGKAVQEGEAERVEMKDDRRAALAEQLTW
jgi:hypothetical protein